MSEDQPESMNVPDHTEQQKLDRLIMKLTDSHRACEDHLRQSIRYARDCGMHLAEAKELLPHGEFEAWVKRNCVFKIRAAQLYMRIHANWATVKPRLDQNEFLSLAQVNRMLTVAKPDPPESQDAAASASPPAEPPAAAPYSAPADPGRGDLRGVKSSPALRKLMRTYCIDVDVMTLLDFLMALDFDAQLVASKLNGLSDAGRPTASVSIVSEPAASGTRVPADSEPR